MCVGSDGGAQNTAHNAENPPPPMTPDEWDIAACRYQPNSVFFPERNNYGQVWDKARRICANCPVKQQCLEAGQHEVWGMWGGLTPSERGFGRSTHSAPMSTERIAALLEHHNQPMTVQQVHQHMNPHYTKNAARNALARLTEGGIITRASNTPPTPDTYRWNHHHDQ
jgi:hypothetical protein